MTGTTRSAGKADALVSLGAHPAVVDALNPDQVMRAVTEAKPEVVIHQLTAISGPLNMRDLDASFAATNQLRTTGLDLLLAAAEAAGARRFVAQSFTGWPNARVGGPVKTEEDPLDEQPAAHSAATLAAIKHVESTVLAAPMESVVLRYGGFYGPGNTLGRDGEVLEMIRKRRLPLVGGGAGIWSFVHIDDAAAATAVAAEGGPVGLFNIVDDEPAPVREWLPYLASVVGAGAPLRLPTWLARPLIGEYGVNAMTANRGSSNTKARRDLGWAPSYASWRDGFRRGLG